MITLADKILLLAVMMAMPLLYLALWSADGNGQHLLVLANGQPERIFPLHTNQELTVEGMLGKSDISIQKSKARFVGSPCQNKICLHQGWISAAGDIAACLPNRVSIHITGTPSRYDAVNF